MNAINGTCDEASPSELWEAIVQEFRSACVLRRQKKFEESHHLIAVVLPSLIGEWSRLCVGNSSAKKQQLDEMFRTEQKRVEDAWILQELLADRLTQQFGASIQLKAQQPARSMALSGARHESSHNPQPKIKFEDIPGVIDLLLARESQEQIAQTT